MVWHMHHRGDSVSEGGSQAAGRKRGERERESEREPARDKTREGKTRGWGGCIVEIRSAPFSETHFNEIMRLSLSDVEE